MYNFANMKKLSKLRYGFLSIYKMFSSFLVFIIFISKDTNNELFLINLNGIELVHDLAKSKTGMTKGCQ